jgi:hypothetical protein
MLTLIEEFHPDITHSYGMSNHANNIYFYSARQTFQHSTRSGYWSVLIDIKLQDMRSGYVKLHHGQDNDVKIYNSPFKLIDLYGGNKIMSFRNDKIYEILKYLPF